VTVLDALKLEKPKGGCWLAGFWAKIDDVMKGSLEGLQPGNQWRILPGSQHLAKHPKTYRRRDKDIGEELQLGFETESSKNFMESQLAEGELGCAGVFCLLHESQKAMTYWAGSILGSEHWHHYLHPLERPLEHGPLERGPEEQASK